MFLFLFLLLIFFLLPFIRTIDGEMYDGVVKQKEEAKRQYSHAVSQDQSAGLITYAVKTKYSVWQNLFFSTFLTSLQFCGDIKITI